jgi:ABC-type transport system substrate-binding protein
VHVRQALAYALDLNAINRAVYAGKAEPANSTIAKMKYWTPKVKPYPHDPGKAAQLMKQSKFPKGFSLDFLVPAGDTVHRSVALIAKDAWAPLGVKVNVLTEDVGSLFTDFSKGKYQATIPMPVITSDILVPDELGLSWLQWTPGYEGFFTNYNNPTLGKLVRKANETLNEAKRGALWQQAQALSMRDVPWIPLFFTPARTAIRDNVSGFQTIESAWWTLAETTKS